nr:hypothetical protein [Tanacetum cinerariifolium]
MIIPELNRTKKFLYKVNELRAISDHMLGAFGVQLPENNLDNLHSISEDGTLELMDPQELLGSILLATNDLIIIELLTGTFFLAAYRFGGVTDWYSEPRFYKEPADMSWASSAVTYTSVYTNSEPERVFWGANEELSDGGLEEPQTPPAPQDEDEHELIQPHDPDFVPEPIYPEYIPLEDEHILPAEEQPLPLVVSPNIESPEYVVESDPEEVPEEYEDDETEDGPVDHPMDGGDDGDDDNGDSSRYDADDEEEDEEDEEEEEHLALADSAVVIPTDELVSPPKGTEPIIPPPSTDTATTGARITI